MIRDGAQRPTALRTAAFATPKGHALFALLRGNTSERPRVDPGLAGGLRAWLEDELAPVADLLDSSRLPFLVDARSLSLEARDLDRSLRQAGERAVSLPLVHSAMVASLFRQLVTLGHVGEPFQDALDGLRASGASECTRFIEAVTADERADLEADVRLHASILQDQWLQLPAQWLARTDDWISVPFAAGRVIISGVVDLVLGAPSTGHASVCLVDVKSGKRRGPDEFERRLCGLLETLRSGAAPFRLATYYSATGEIDVEELTEDALADTVSHVIERIHQQAGTSPFRAGPT